MTYMTRLNQAAADVREARALRDAATTPEERRQAQAELDGAEEALHEARLYADEIADDLGYCQDRLHGYGDEGL